jgi:hypothetical protein
VRFRLDGREYIVVEVLAQWYGPGGAFYDVRTDEGDWYRLEHQNSMPDAAWQLVEYRRGLH